MPVDASFPPLRERDRMSVEVERDVVAHDLDGPIGRDKIPGEYVGGAESVQHVRRSRQIARHAERPFGSTRRERAVLAHEVSPALVHRDQPVVVRHPGLEPLHTMHVQVERPLRAGRSEPVSDGLAVLNVRGCREIGLPRDAGAGLGRMHPVAAGYDSRFVAVQCVNPRFLRRAEVCTTEAVPRRLHNTLRAALLYRFERLARSQRPGRGCGNGA